MASRNGFAETMWVAFHLQKQLTFFSALDIVRTRTVYILTTNELVKLTML